MRHEGDEVLDGACGSVRDGAEGVEAGDTRRDDCGEGWLHDLCGECAVQVVDDARNLEAGADERSDGE